MRFKRHKPKERKTLDRWALPKRVKLALQVVPDEYRKIKSRRRTKICNKTKQPHDFLEVECVLTAYKFEDKYRYMNWYQHRIQCRHCGKKKLRGFWKIPTQGLE